MKKKVIPIIIAGLLFVGAAIIFEYKTQDTIKITVTDKTSVVKSEETDNGYKTYTVYRIYSEQEVFELKDQLAFLKFNSSDIYAKIQIGQTYTFKVSGIRIPYLSIYRNIIEVHD